MKGIKQIMPWDLIGDNPTVTLSLNNFDALRQQAQETTEKLEEIYTQIRNLFMLDEEEYEKRLKEIGCLEGDIPDEALFEMITEAAGALTMVVDAGRLKQFLYDHTGPSNKDYYLTMQEAGEEGLKNMKIKLEVGPWNK